MKNYFLFLLILISACSSSKINTEEPNTDVNTELILAKEKVPDITLERLKLGKKMYSQNCSGCHALYTPLKFTAQRWQPILARMLVKAKISDSTQKKLIADYVIAKSK